MGRRHSKHVIHTRIVYKQSEAELAAIQKKEREALEQKLATMKHKSYLEKIELERTLRLQMEEIIKSKLRAALQLQQEEFEKQEKQLLEDIHMMQEQCML